MERGATLSHDPVVARVGELLGIKEYYSESAVETWVDGVKTPTRNRLLFRPAAVTSGGFLHAHSPENMRMTGSGLSVELR